MTPAAVVFNSWNDGFPEAILLDHLVPSLSAALHPRLGSRRCNGKLRLLNKTWKALVDANVQEVSCATFSPSDDYWPECPTPQVTSLSSSLSSLSSSLTALLTVLTVQCPPNEVSCATFSPSDDYWPECPTPQVTSLLCSVSPASLRKIFIPTTKVTEGLLEAVLSKTSLTRLTLSGHGPSVKPTNPVLAKFSQLVNLKSLSIFGTRQETGGEMMLSVSWWFKGDILADALRGIPELATATLDEAGTRSHKGHKVAAAFIKALPSASLKHLGIYSYENVLFNSALSRFRCLVSLTVDWYGDDYGDDDCSCPGDASWSLDLLRQLQPLKNLREVEVTKLSGIGHATATKYLPNIRDWGSTTFASCEEEASGMGYYDGADYDEYDPDEWRLLNGYDGRQDFGDDYLDDLILHELAVDMMRGRYL